MKIERLIESIEDAIEKQCFLPALALALVLPDICAQFDYPKIYNKKEEYDKHKGQGAAYAKWYDEYIGNYDIIPNTDIRLLDGWGCWKLRCGFLHSGSIDIDNNISSKDVKIHFKLASSNYSNFKYTLGGVSSVSCFENNGIWQIEVDVANLCGKIIAVVKQIYLKNEKFISETEKKFLNYVEYDF